jgi:hypothetical protein
MTYTFPKWSTALDLDLTASGTQTLASDTNYNIGTSPYTGSALVWTKANSASDSTAMALTNGTGLIITPNSASVITTSTFSAPVLRIPVNSIIPNWTFATPFRMWVWESASNEAASGDQFQFGVYIPGSGFANQLTLAHFRGFAGGVNGFGANIIALQAGVTNTTTSIPLATGNRVGLMHFPMGVLGGTAPLLIGTTVTGGVWPAQASLTYCTSPITAPSAGAISNTSSGAHTVPEVNFFLAAQRNGSGTAFAATIARIRVDYIPTFE